MTHPIRTLILAACSVAVASTGGAQEFQAHHAFVASPEANKVTELDEDLNFVRDLTAPGLAIPHALAFGPDGLLYVGSATKKVFVLDGAGNVVRDFDAGGGPGGLAFGSAGILYATSDEQLRAIDALSGSPGIAATMQLVEPATGLAVGADGRLYVGAPSSDAFLRITPELTRSGQMDTGFGPHALPSPEAIAVGPRGRFYTTDFLSDEVLVFTGKGLAIDAIPLDGLEAPDGLAFDRRGRLWVTSNDDDEIALVDVDTKQVTRVDLAPLGVLRPAAVAFAPVRFLAKVKGKLTHADGAVEKIAEEVELSWAPGSNRSFVRLLELDNGATLFDRFFDEAWVFHGTELGDLDDGRRLLDQVEIQSFAQAGGIARVVLKAKGSVDAAGRYEPAKLSGRIRRSNGSLTFEGKLKAKIRLN